MIELLLEGTPFDRGRTHGQRFAGQIRAAVLDLWKRSRTDALVRTIEESAAHVDGIYPEINEEIRGIASGARVAFAQAFLYNNRAILNVVPLESCSHVAIIGDGNTVAGMNKDSRGTEASEFFVAKVRPSQGHARIGYCHIGRLWGYGVNDAGLCTAGTAAYPVPETSPAPALGLYFVGPIALSMCGNVAEALVLVAGLGDVAESGNVLFADQSDAAVVEFAPGRRVVRRPEQGVIASTNFYASGQIQHARSKAYLEETRARYHNILRLSRHPSPAAVDSLRHVLSHHSENGSVCRHEHTEDQTVFSFIVSPGEQRFLITDGPPCRCDYVSHSLA